MQVYSNHLFSNLPRDLFGLIYSSLPPEDKKKLSQVDKVIFEMALAMIHSIRLFSPYPDSNKEAPETTLVNLIKRYPNARTLTLGPKSSFPSTGCEGFGESEEKHLRAMIAFFKAHPEQPFRKIEIHEITNTWKKTPDEKAELHRSLIESLRLSMLNSIVIRVLSNHSVLNGDEIQPILGSGIKLKKFQLIRDEFIALRSSYSTKMAISLSFQNQTSLISAKFHHLHIHLNTILSLIACTELETLVLNQCHFGNSDIKTLLTLPHPWKLKRLEIPKIDILSDHELDAVTKQLPNLETLHITLKNVKEEGFKKLSENCPKLHTLKLCYQIAKDQEIQYLTTYFPNLEMLSFEGGSITEKGIAFLNNCSKLRILKIGNLKNLETLCIKTLPQALPQLEALEITHSELIIVKELPYLIENMPKLVYLQIKSDDNISTQKHLAKLRKTFPQLLETPPTRKIQQFLL